MKISVTIPCFKSATTIRQCVRAIIAQTVPVHEIIVIDDCSPDESGLIAAEEGCVVERTAENIGLSASMNRALALCTGTHLAKIDSDVVLEPTWLQEALQQMDDGDLDVSRIVGVGGRIIEFHTNTVADRWRSVFMRQHWGSGRQVNPPGLFGADQLFRVDALRDVGGWNPKYRTNHEDMVLSNALMTRGYHLVYTPAALAFHLRRDTLHSVLANFWRWYYTTADEAGKYDNVSGLIELIGRNKQMAVERFNVCQREGWFDLLWPCFLLYYSQCFHDVAWAAKRGWMTSEMVAATQAQIGVWAANDSLKLGLDGAMDVYFGFPRPARGACQEYVDALIAATFASELAGGNVSLLQKSVEMAA